MKNTAVQQVQVNHWSYDTVNQCKNNRLIKSYFHKIDSSLEYHTHDFYEINIISSGAGLHFVGERELTVCPGDVFVIPPGMGHGYRSSGELTVFHLLLSERFMSSVGRLLENLDGYRTLFSIEPQIRLRTEFSYYLRAGGFSLESLFRFIDTLTDSSDSANDMEELDSALSAARLIAFLSDSIRHIDVDIAENSGEKHTLSVIGAMEYLDRHFDEPLDSSVLADRCCMSYSCFLRAFKRLSGKTPSEYQSSLRIKKAEKQLLSSSDSVLKIAMDLGYYDSAHFIKEFQKHKNLSPTEYRKKQKLH